MRPNHFFPYALGITLAFNLASICLAQSPLRVAIFPFDDRTTANKDMNIGAKVADHLIARLAGNKAFTVYDRQHLDLLLQEKNRKYDPNYDSAAAAKSALLGLADIVISGQVEAFNENTRDKTNNHGFEKLHTINGVVSLNVTAHLISVERGSIIAAPSASDEQKGELATETIYVVPMPHGKTHEEQQAETTANTEQGLRKLADKAGDEVAKQLAAQIISASVGIVGTPTTLATVERAVSFPASLPSKFTDAKFLGISDGLAYIDKGSTAGVKEGDKFTVRRVVDTGLKEPSGKSILRHKPVCSLVIATIEDTSAAGKCSPQATGADGIPRDGDEVVQAAQ